MSITNITRTNTVDEWRIQTNLSANAINTIETGDYTKTSGTLEFTGASNVIIDSIGTSLQVTNTALFTTNVTVGKEISLGAQETATGNLGVGGVVSIYGPGNALYVANNVTSNGSVIVKETILANTITVNSNTVVVGTTNTGFLGVANTVTVGKTLSVTGNATTGNLNTSGLVYADAVRTVGRMDVGGVFHAISTATFDNDVSVAGDLSVDGNFTLTGDIVYDTDTFILSTNTPVTAGYAYLGVYRGNTTSTLGTVNANSYIRWTEDSKLWEIRDVDNSDNTTSFSRILTANIISASLSSVSNTNFPSTWVTKNYADNSTIGPYLKANAAFEVANLASNTFNGTTGSVTPSNGVISFATNNGMIVAGSSNTLTISTPQDLRTTATPTFASLSLTAPLPISQGGTGATSAESALTALLPTGTTSGYVLTTGGPGSFYWAAGGTGGGGGASPGTRIATTRLSYTGNGAGYHYATPTFSDTTQLRVYIDGVRQMASEYTANISNSRVMFSEAPKTGSPILVEIDGYTTYEYYANNITYGPVTGSIPSSANTIQLAIDSLESRKAALTGATFTGNALGITQNANTSNTTFATTAYVQAALNLSGNTFNHNISGNAGTVTNGVYTNGSYSDPSWITSLSGNKVTNATTSVKGVVQLADSVSNTSTTAAATANAVKSAYDGALANTGAVNIALSNEITNRQANTGAALIAAKAYTNDAGNITTGTLSAARLGTGSAPQFGSLGVGTAASGTTGEIRATGDITAGYSDDGLKTKLGVIENALDKVAALSGFYFVPNDVAKALGYSDKQQVGVSAQEVQKVLPEVVVSAPIGDEYLTVQYEKLVPLLIEAIKELKSEVEELKGQIK
jgi:hypothetical protein